MARKRQIDPEIWSSEHMALVCIEARFLFIGMFSIADDEGRLKATAGYLRAKIFPYDDLTNDQVRAWRDQLAAAFDPFTGAPLVALYYPTTTPPLPHHDGSGGELAWIPGFEKHQYINKFYKSKLTAPPPLTRNDGSAPVVLPHHDATTPVSTDVDVDSDIDHEVDVRTPLPPTMRTADELLTAKAVVDREAKKRGKDSRKALLSSVQMTVSDHGEDLARRALSEMAGEMGPGQRKIVKLPGYYATIVARLVGEQR